MFRKKLLELYGEEASQIIINDDYDQFIEWYDQWWSTHLDNGTLMDALNLLVPLVALNNATKILKRVVHNLNDSVFDKAMAIYLDPFNQLNIAFDPNSLTQMELMIADQNTPTEVLHLINLYIIQTEVHKSLLASPCAKTLINHYINNMGEQCMHADTNNLQVSSGLPILNATIKINNMQKIVSLVEHIFPDEDYEPQIQINIIQCTMSLLKSKHHDHLSSVIKSKKVNLENDAHIHIPMLLSYLKKSLESIFKRIIGEISDYAKPNKVITIFPGSLFGAQDAGRRSEAFRIILSKAENLPETDIFEKLSGLCTILGDAAEKYHRDYDVVLAKATQNILSHLASISNGMFGNYYIEIEFVRKVPFYHIHLEDVRVLQQLDEIFSAHEKENKKTMSFSGDRIEMHFSVLKKS